MNLYLKNITSALILIIGLILFLSSILNNNINLALVYLSLTLIFWVVFSLLVDNFDVHIFSWIISSTGFILSIAIFFIYGIEEVAHPVGAIIFHTGGIASSLGIGLFSLFPILIIYQLNNQTKKSKLLSIVNNKESKNNIPELESDDWEIANNEDINSNEFEIK
tara:strand:+ start:5000 stop:5491 length:492 start_codon:yes stop_codon:yes gene_type:complete